MFNISESLRSSWLGGNHLLMLNLHQSMWLQFYYRHWFYICNLHLMLKVPECTMEMKQWLCWYLLSHSEWAFTCLYQDRIGFQSVSEPSAGHWIHASRKHLPHGIMGISDHPYEGRLQCQYQKPPRPTVSYKTRSYFGVVRRCIPSRLRSSSPSHHTSLGFLHWIK